MDSESRKELERIKKKQDLELGAIAASAAVQHQQIQRLRDEQSRRDREAERLRAAQQREVQKGLERLDKHRQAEDERAERQRALRQLLWEVKQSSIEIESPSVESASRLIVARFLRLRAEQSGLTPGSLDAMADKDMLAETLRRLADAENTSASDLGSEAKRVLEFFNILVSLTGEQAPTKISEYSMEALLLLRDARVLTPAAESPLVWKAVSHLVSSSAPCDGAVSSVRVFLEKHSAPWPALERFAYESPAAAAPTLLSQGEPSDNVPRVRAWRRGLLDHVRRTLGDAPIARLEETLRLRDRISVLSDAHGRIMALFQRKREAEVFSAVDRKHCDIIRRRSGILGNLTGSYAAAVSEYLRELELVAKQMGAADPRTWSDFQSVLRQMEGVLLARDLEQFHRALAARNFAHERDVAAEETAIKRLLGVDMNPTCAEVVAEWANLWARIHELASGDASLGEISNGTPVPPASPE